MTHIILHFEPPLSVEVSTSLETELSVLGEVKEIRFNPKKNRCFVSFASETAKNSVLTLLREKNISFQKEEIAATAQQLYFVTGLHCAACEIILEKKISTLPGVHLVEASTTHGTLTITHSGTAPEISSLDTLFKNEGYHFSLSQKKTQPFLDKEWWRAFCIAFIFLISFLWLNTQGLASRLSLTNTSSLFSFTIFGLIASFSTCAALVGGLVLSLSKKWSSTYGNEVSSLRRMQPHLLFNAGRLTAYGLGGMILGTVGNLISPSLTTTSILTIFVSLLMIVLALQMLEIPFFQKIQLHLPKKFTTQLTDEKNFAGRLMPFFLGAATFFLPCGFTLIVQGIALISGAAWHGGLIMFFFALGTLPTLLTIGLGSISFASTPRFSRYFSLVAGFVVLFFSLYTINSEFNLLGLPSLNDLSFGVHTRADDGTAFAPLINGKQLLKMNAIPRAYSPNYFKIRTGKPVRWEITDQGAGGCENVIIARELFNDKIILRQGETSVKEFEVTRPGKYKFSCSMGMYNGVIEAL